MGSIYSYSYDKESNMNRNLGDLSESLYYIFSDYDLDNGLCLGNVYLPEEIIINILSFLPINDIWNLRLVCKRWYNLTKTQSLWSTIFQRNGKKVPKKLPWYVCFKCLDNSILDINLLRNNCGQEKFVHWMILHDGGHQLKVEDTPVGCDEIPTNVSDFNGAKSCFVTSFHPSRKVQVIELKGKLSKYIIRKYKPHICVSEWYAGRFDCGGRYELKARIYHRPRAGDQVFMPMGLVNPVKESDIIFEQKKEVQFEANEATAWQKVEILIEDYPDDIAGVLFEHKGSDNQFWAGHYGTKMAGGVVKFLSESIESKLNV